MQNPNFLQAKIEALEQIVYEMESAKPDDLARKWRVKVFEEIVRNKQQQIVHSQEIKKFKEEEKKLKFREQQIKTALESAHMQASSLNIERVKLQKEIQSLQGKLRSNLSSTVLLNLQSIMTMNLDLNTKVSAMIDTFNHRIAFSMSKIKTAKILHIRELFGLKNKYSEEMAEHKKLKEEFSKLRIIEYEKESLAKENNKLSSTINEINEKFKNAEKQANLILMENNEKYKNCVNDLEAQLNEKVEENITLYDNLDKATKEQAVFQSNVMKLKKDLEEKSLENQSLSNKLEDLSEKYVELNKNLKEKNERLEGCKEEIEKLMENDKEKEEKWAMEKDKMQKIIDERNEQVNELMIKNEELQAVSEEKNQELLSKIEFLTGKNFKVETQVRELKRERDVLFENVKKIQPKLKFDKDTQTETGLKQTIIKKTVAPRPRFIDSDTTNNKDISD